MQHRPYHMHTSIDDVNHLIFCLAHQIDLHNTVDYLYIAVEYRTILHTPRPWQRKNLIWCVHCAHYRKNYREISRMHCTLIYALWYVWLSAVVFDIERSKDLHYTSILKRNISHPTDNFMDSEAFNMSLYTTLRNYTLLSDDRFNVRWTPALLGCRSSVNKWHARDCYTFATPECVVSIVIQCDFDTCISR